jgi:hypothetical protein
MWQPFTNFWNSFRPNKPTGPAHWRTFSTGPSGQRLTFWTPEAYQFFGKTPEQMGVHMRESVRETRAKNFASLRFRRNFKNFYSAASIGKRMGTYTTKWLPLDLVFAAFDTAGTGISEAARWAAKSGDPADYVGGFYFGIGKGIARNALITTAMAAGYAFGGGIGATIAGIGSSFIADKVMMPLVGDYLYGRSRWMSSVARTSLAKKRINFGGNFRDSEAAYTMRQLAVQEMAGSLTNARQFLGNESSFMHR